MANSDQEIKTLEKRIKKHPDSPLFARLADLYLREGDAEHAIEICEEGLQKHPFYVTAHLVMSRCYAAVGMSEQSKAELKRSLLFDPLTPSATKVLGDLLHEEGWENLYYDSLRRLSDMDPLNGEIMGMVAEIPAPSALSEMQDGGPAETVHEEPGEEDVTVPETGSDEFPGTDDTSPDMQEEILDAGGDLPESALASSIGGDVPILKSERGKFAPEKDIPLSEESQAETPEHEASPQDESPGGGDFLTPEGEEETVLSDEAAFTGSPEEVSPEDQLLESGALEEPEEGGTDLGAGGESAGSWNETTEGDFGSWETPSGEAPEELSGELGVTDSVKEGEMPESAVTEHELSTPADELPEGSWDTIDSTKMEEVDRILADDTEKEEGWKSEDLATDQGDFQGDASELDFDDTVQAVIEEENDSGMADTDMSLEEAGEEISPEAERPDTELMSVESEDELISPADESAFGDDEALTSLETFGEDSIKSEDEQAIPEIVEEPGGEDILADADAGIEESPENGEGETAAPEIVEQVPLIPDKNFDDFEDSFDGIDAEDINLELIDREESIIPELAGTEMEDEEQRGVLFPDIPLVETGEVETTGPQEADELVDLENTESELLGNDALTELDTLEDAETSEIESGASDKIIDPLEVETEEDEVLLAESGEELGLSENLIGEEELPSLMGEEESLGELPNAEEELEEISDLAIDDGMDLPIDEHDLPTATSPDFEEAENLTAEDELSGRTEGEEFRLTVHDEGEAAPEEIDDFDLKMRDIEELENLSLLRAGRIDDDNLPGREFEPRDEDELAGGRDRDLREAADKEAGKFPGAPRREGGRGAGRREIHTRDQDKAKTGQKRDLRDEGNRELGEFPGGPHREAGRVPGGRDLKTRALDEAKTGLKRDSRDAGDEELGEFPGGPQREAGRVPGGRDLKTRARDEAKTGLKRDLRDAGDEKLGEFPGTARKEDGSEHGRRDLRTRDQEKPKKWLERDLREAPDEELGELPLEMREGVDRSPGSREFDMRIPDELKTGLRREGLPDAVGENVREDGTPDLTESGVLSDAFATLTLGEIYIAQGQHDKAIEVYKKLKIKYPDDKKVASKLRKARRMKKNLKKSTEDGDEDEKE